MPGVHTIDPEAPPPAIRNVNFQTVHIIPGIGTYLARSVKSPPRTGAMPQAKAQTPERRPKYNPRSRIENRSHTQMLTRVSSPAAPNPCTARPNRNNDMVSATEQIRLPAKKIPIAMSKSGFLPHISDTLPHAGIVAQLARMYELPIHVYPELE